MKVARGSRSAIPARSGEVSRRGAREINEKGGKGFTDRTPDGSKWTARA